MRNTVVVDGSLGDSGKAKVVDYIAKDAKIVVRFNGSGNAGHTVYKDGKKFVFHQVPAGVLYPHIVNVIATGVMVDPIALVEEIRQLRERDISITPDNLKISCHSSVITPIHKSIDNYEEDRTNNKIGTTRRGVGPSVIDKVGRRGLRLGDLVDKTKVCAKFMPFSEYVKAAETYELFDVAHYFGRPYYDVVIDMLTDAGQFLQPFITDTSLYLHNQAISKAAPASIVFEGAQGPLLDVDHGSYPYVTSTNCVAAYAAVGSGIGAHHLHDVVAVVKAYATRVANGPFPTEMPEELASRLRESAGEFGATTKRKRRIGWLDLPAIKYGIRINGVTQLAITRLDSLAGFGNIKVCFHYTINGKKYEELPFDHNDLFDAVPNYITCPGWKEDISNARSWDELPKTVREYLGFIEDCLGVHVKYISTGPNREQMIEEEELV